MNKNSVYFLQSVQWANFWLKANNDNHEIHQIKCQIELNDQPIELVAYIYQYPWHLKQNFLYIPKGPFLQCPVGFYPNKDQISQLLESFLKEVVLLAKNLKAVFIKIDFDDTFTSSLQLYDNEQLDQFFKKQFNYNFKFNSKKLQYLQTSLLNCNLLLKSLNNHKIDLQKIEHLKDFYEQNTEFWSVTNQGTRRGTRKSFEENWQISTDKNPSNFEAFWKLIKETGNRQNFGTHSQEYYRQLLVCDFSRIIILRDQKGIPHTAWLGVNINNNLVYLYGGNSLESRKTNSQYLLHLIAIAIAFNEGCNFYDLGGYDPEKGYGKFKEGYRGKIQTFLGPIDIINSKIKYSLINKIINTTKQSHFTFKKFFNSQLKITDLLFKFIIGLLITTCLPFWFFTVTTYLPQNHVSNSKEIEVAIVFGASVDFVNLVPSLVLQKRLDKSLDLYNQGKIKTILVSGDNREANYNEPFVMKKYLVDQGVPAVNIVEDFGGRRTLDTCWRAKNVFKADRAYLITQRFHLPRTDYNCRQVGLETIPTPAPDSNFNTTFWGVIREIPASWLALQETFRGYEAPVKSDGTEVNI